MLTQADYAIAIHTRNQTSDEGLILACRQDDGDAWDALVNRYQRLIYTIPLRAGLDEDQAAEVFQRTFAKLLENLDRIRQPERIHAWLVTTARRETLHLLREQHAERSFSQAEKLDSRPRSEAIPDDKPLPSEMLERIEEQHFVRLAISTMDDRSRNLLTLLYYHPNPLSYAEIAAVLNMPESSVGPTRARCLEKLRRLLEDAGF
jgi:RNA polymerase sigma factor (sigma-70 family)